jgi:hypothetical protein
MKKLQFNTDQFLIIKELLKGFIKWLGSKHYYTKKDKLIKFKKCSIPNYIKDMAHAIQDLGVAPMDFIRYSRLGLLKAFLKRLQESASFKNREVKIQSNIISAFNAYIKYRTAVA